MKTASMLSVAFVTLSLQAPAAIAKAPPGFDPAGTGALKDVPVQVVVANDRLRVQLPYGEVLVDVATGKIPNMSFGASVGVGVAGGLIGGLIVNASIFAAAKDQVRPGSALIDTAGCDLQDGDALATTAEQAVHATGWGAAATLHRHILADGQKLETQVPEDAPRLTIMLSYSLSPDFSTVMTTAEIQAFTSAIPVAPSHWQSDPAWSDHLVYVSDALDLAPKTQADIDRAVAAENARYEASGVDALVEKANKDDDMTARQQAVQMMKDHDDALRDAKRKDWSLQVANMERSRMWTENGCARLHSTLAANEQGLLGMLTQLFAGQLPAADPKARMQPAFVLRKEPVGERRVVAFATPARLFVSRRDGDNAFVGYRYSWFDDSANKH